MSNHAEELKRAQLQAENDLREVHFLSSIVMLID